MATSRVLPIADRSQRRQELAGPVAGKARLLTDPPRATPEIVNLPRQDGVGPIQDRDMRTTTSTGATIPDSTLLKQGWRPPRAMSCVRIVLALIWLTAAVSHMFWGAPHPCTCTHP